MKFSAKKKWVKKSKTTEKSMLKRKRDWFLQENQNKLKWTQEEICKNSLKLKSFKMVDGKWHKDKQQIKHKQKDWKKTAGGKKDRGQIY